MAVTNPRRAQQFTTQEVEVPSLAAALAILTDAKSTLPPGHRLVMRLSGALAKSETVDDYNWDLIEELQMAARGNMPEGMWATLREAEGAMCLDIVRP